MGKAKKRRQLVRKKRDERPQKRQGGKVAKSKATKPRSNEVAPVVAKAPGQRKRPVVKPDVSVSPRHDYSFTQNREESWLRFDGRVLDEALDETVPLFERLKFVSIFGSNLDEWFMVRIGGLSDLTVLKRQPIDTRSGMTPSEQIENALSMLPELVDRQAAAFTGLEANLSGSGLTRVHVSDLTDADLRKVARFFESKVAPIISPMIVDPRHPFPNLKNGRLYVACSLDGPDEEGLLGLVEVPHSLSRVVELPSTPHNYRYMLVEDVIISRLSECFGVYVPTSSAILRVTRNADVDPDGDGIAEDSDYRAHMKKVLKRRLRLQAVRLEVQGQLKPEIERFVVGALRLTDTHVFHTTIPLDLGYVFSLEGKAGAASGGRLLFEPFEPQRSPRVDEGRPMREQVEERDILLTYPYESMSPLLRLLREAANDASCISIKVTLYRVASQSKLCESLIAAVENGKEVTVLMELRARFDEENNIAWAERLEAAGCTVIYGSEGFKCHSKICQITYHDGGSIRRITCLGTGNFNEKTARLYSDFMLLTSHEGIGEDGNTFFRNLSLGNLFGTYRYLGVAPVGLKPLVMHGLDREIARAHAGEPAFVFMKMNSLTDRDVIDKIAEACEAGVPVVMIVRGITCIRANVPGKTEGLVMRQIVGRFLEHARIYAFGTEADTLYLSSADMMTRNTEHRVEIAYPVLDDDCRRSVVRYINLQLADNAKARQLTSQGTWEKVEQRLGEPLVLSQELLLSLAYRRASSANNEQLVSFIPSSAIMEHLPAETLRRIVSIPTSEIIIEDDADEALAEEAQEAGEAAASSNEADEAMVATEGAVVAPGVDVPAKVAEASPFLGEGTPVTVADEPVAATEPALLGAEVGVPAVEALPSDGSAAAPTIAAEPPAAEAVPAVHVTDEDVSPVTEEAKATEEAPTPDEADTATAPADEAAAPAGTDEAEARSLPFTLDLPALEGAPAPADVAAEPFADDGVGAGAETTPDDETDIPEVELPEAVDAHIISEAHDEAPGEPAAQATTTLAKREYGRFRMGLHLIALGLKAIFTGRWPGKE